MQTPRLVRRLLALTVALAFVLMATAPLSAQDGGRTPETLAFFPSGETANATVVDEPTTYQFANGTSGTGPTINSPCTAPGGAGQPVTVAAWISDPVFAYPASIVSVASLTMAIVPAPGSAPVIPGPPQAVTAGDVTFTLQVGAMPDDSVHEFSTATFTVDGPATAGSPLNASMPASIAFTFPAPGSGAHPANSAIVAILSVSCNNTASFAIQPDSAVSFDFLYGQPTDTDTDADGVPNALDDDDDGDGVTDTDEQSVGSSATDAASTPTTQSTSCPDYTFQEVFDATGSPDECPEEASFPWLLILLVLLGVILLLALIGGAVLVTNRKVKMTVSHDGFQAIEKGQSAEYELTLMAVGKKEEVVPVELSLKGVPEDWSAVLEPSHLNLMSGEAAEAQLAVLRLIPPPGEDYESEAQVAITATPTDEEGKTSATKPGTSVKTKTIVNIGVTPPDGEKKAKKPKRQKAQAEGEALQAAIEEAEAEEKPKRKFGAGMLKRKKKDDEEGEAEPAEAAPAAKPSQAPAAAAAAAAAPTAEGKPQIAMGKMEHDPADFSAGDNVTTKVSVRNKGDAPVQGLRLSLFVNDERADQKEVDIEPGGSVDVVFNWTAQPDENRVRIKGGLKGA